MRPRVVLVTGVSRYLGTRLASCLAADPSIERIIGVDTVPPRAEATTPAKRVNACLGNRYCGNTASRSDTLWFGLHQALAASGRRDCSQRARAKARAKA